MNFLAIVPARGGSKGIKDKNIIEIAGNPLIAYTIAPLIRLKAKGTINEAIVSTDSDKIASVSKSLGMSVPFLRPGSISGDRAKSVDFVLHALSYFLSLGKAFDAVVILQPTSPLRNEQDIEGALQLFSAHPNSESLITCYKEPSLSDLIVYKKDNIFAAPLNEQHNKGVRRQESESLYVRNGAIYIVSSTYIREYLRIISEKPLLFEMPKSRSVNLDSLQDLEVLRGIMCA